MKEKRRFEVICETSRTTTIRFGRDYPANVFCRSCRSDAPHLSVAEVAAVANISEAAVFDLKDAGRIHSTETGSGLLMICGNSLSTETKNIEAIK